MKITFAKPGLPATGVVVVSAGAGGKLSASAVKLDKKSGGALSRAIRASNFEGDRAQSLSVMAPAGSKLDKVMIVGLGKPDDITELEMQRLGGLIYAGAKQAKKGSVAVAVDAVTDAKMTAADIAAEIAFGANLRSYRFDKYKTKLKPADKPSIKSLTLQCSGFANARGKYVGLRKIADGVFFTRDLVSEPGNVIYPDTLAKQAKTLEKLGVKVQILGEAEMRRLGMGALLGVGQGSARDSKLVVMQWNGGPKGKAKAAQPIAFVGKGVTFDTGGISIKPREGLDELKCDMGGSGVVIGLMKALAGRKAKVNVVGVVGCVENMPDGNAQRPGDIVTSMSGQTIEILDTDGSPVESNQGKRFDVSSGQVTWIEFDAALRIVVEIKSPFDDSPDPVDLIRFEVIRRPSTKMHLDCFAIRMQQIPGQLNFPLEIIEVDVCAAVVTADYGSASAEPAECFAKRQVEVERQWPRSDVVIVDVCD